MKLFNWLKKRKSAKDILIEELLLKISALEKENEYLRKQVKGNRNARKRKTSKRDSKA